MWLMVAESREEPLGSSKSREAGRWGPGPEDLLEAPPRALGTLLAATELGGTWGGECCEGRAGSYNLSSNEHF